MNKDFGKKPRSNGNSNKGPRKKTHNEKRLACEIKALKATVPEKKETILAMRTASSNSTSP